MNQALKQYHKILSGQVMPKFKSADLSNKIETALSHLQSCELCEHRCQALRDKGIPGECNVVDKLFISSTFDHYGEESFLVPSFTIFFKSCNFSCQFCQNWDISQTDYPITESNLTVEQLAVMIENHNHCRNVNFVGGEPTPYLPFILQTLDLVESNIPVVWNSNFYMSDEAMDMLKGVVDVYLSDFKYGNNECGSRLSKVNNYFDIISENHKKAFDDAELVIRHLVLPSHFECCSRPILEFVHDNFKDKAVVNIMGQYRPCYNAKEYPEIARPVSFEEISQTINLAEKLNLNYIT